jgi:hypothetical protein
MHCAVALTEHAVCASNWARSSQPTFAWTEHVAWHDESHLSLQLDCVAALQFDEHSCPHWSTQNDAHALGLMALAHVDWQLPPHRELQAAAQSAFAFALQLSAQSVPQPVKQLPVALVSQWVSNAPPRSAWHWASTLICAHVRGHCIFAVS